MAAIVNDRDVLIMSAVPRYSVPANMDMRLSPESAIFKAAADGLSASPSSFVFTATLLNLAGTVTFTASAGLTLTISGNTATLAFANFGATDGTITATITVDGVTYTKKSTVTKLFDGAKGNPGLNSPPQTAAQLKDTLVGALTTDQFVTSLQSSIGLIDAPAKVAGSVNARLKVESDARAAAISTEVTDRGAAIVSAMNAEVAARNAAIVNYGYTKEASDQSLAQFGTTITAAYRTYTDTKTGQALTDAKAFTQSWGYSVADANSAIAASANTLNTNIAGAVSTAKAYTDSTTYSRSAIDAAETAQFNALTANYRGYADGVGQAATSASDAAMRSYTLSTASINGAISTATNTLTASYTDAIAAMTVAGRNIVRDGAFELGLRPWTTKSAYVNRVAVFGEFGAKYLFIESVATAGPDNDAYVNGDGPVIPVTPGVQYIIAFDYATAQASSITASSCYLYGANIGLPIPVLDTNNVRRRASMLWTCPADGSVTSVLPRFGIHTTGYAWMAVYNFMIAAGNKDPGYTAAPEDTPQLAAAAQAAAVVTAAADVRAYTTSTAGINGAITSSANSLTSSFQSADASNLAAARSYADSAITAYGYSFAGANNAIATSTNAVTSRLNNIGGATIEQTFSTQASAIAGLHASWSLKLDVNGAIAGIILAGDSTGGTSTFAVVADKFALRYPGLNSMIPFAVGMVNGQSVIGLNGTVVLDGSLTARTLAAGSITASKLAISNGGLALNKDPNFVDIAGSWTGPANLVVGSGAGGNGPASTFIGMGPAAGGIIFCTERVSIDPSKTYLLAASLYQDSGMSNLCITLIDFFDNSGSRLATSWGDSNYSGYPLVVTPPAGTWTTYRTGVFGANSGIGHSIPAGAKTCRIGASLNANSGLQSGLMGLTAFRLEEQLGSTSIQGGAITAEKIAVDRLSAIQAELGDAVISTSGGLRSGQSTYNSGTGWFLGMINGSPRLSIGTAGGRGLRWDGVDLIIDGPKIGDSMTGSISPTFYNVVRTSNVQFTNVYAGTFTGSAGNASSNLQYLWSAESDNSAVSVNITNSRASQAVVYVTGKLLTGQEVNVQVTCQITDLNNSVSRAPTSNINIQVQ